LWADGKQLHQAAWHPCTPTLVPFPSKHLHANPAVAHLLLIQVDFLHGPSDKQQQTTAAAADSAAAADAADAAAADSSSSGSSSNTVRTATAVVDGQAKQFGVEYLMKYPTKGGFMFDVVLSFDHMETQHR
jgi:hypothetical protein